MSSAPSRIIGSRTVNVVVSPITLSTPISPPAAADGAGAEGGSVRTG